MDQAVNSIWIFIYGDRDEPVPETDSYTMHSVYHICNAVTVVYIIALEIYK